MSNITKQTPELKPLPLWQSSILFAVPAIFIFGSVYGFLPWLVRQGIPSLTAFLVAHLVPMAVLFAVALEAYRREGRPLEWAAFSERFRYPKITYKAVLWGVGIFLAAMVGYGIFSQLGGLLISKGLIPLPENLPALLDPRIKLSVPMLVQESGSTTLKRQWGTAFIWFLMLFFNIAGEEFWWRGYIFPRQELTHGKWTWVIHGVMWTLFHFFKWWDMIGLLPVCLIIAYSAQRLKNNWPAFISHYLFNGMGFIAFLLAVLGVIS
jgi:membrane protease YdiL (CAAX protease family)